MRDSELVVILQIVSWLSIIHCVPISAFSLTTVNGTLTSDVVADEGDLLEICFATSVSVTRTTVEVDIQVLQSATDATIIGME